MTHAARTVAGLRLAVGGGWGIWPRGTAGAGGDTIRVVTSRIPLRSRPTHGA